MKDNVVLTKSKDFAIRIINVYKYLREEKREPALSKQLLRSGTSIGANVNEAVCGISHNARNWITCILPYSRTIPAR